MKELVFASNNLYKVSEIRKILPVKFTLLTPADIGFHDEIPETGNTIEENSIQKAKFIYNLYKTDCFADDTGLETEALNNEPGVYSARYAGEGKNFESNIDKLLKNLENITNRKARFLTVISLIYKGKLFLFNGIVKGLILGQRKGSGGFGYDSVFQPDEFFRTFAEMPVDEKNKISHRGIAVRKLVNFLETL